MKVSRVKTQNADLIGKEKTIYTKSEIEAAGLIGLYLCHFSELGSVGDFRYCEKCLVD